MWKLKSISATNFTTYPEVSFDFKDKVYVIQAQNFDNSGQLSNGSGKTSFIEMIAIAILGYSLSGKNTKNFVAWNSDTNYFTVHCELSNEETKQEVVIERKFYSNTRSAELILLVNGKVPTTIPSKKGVENGIDVKEGNKYILNELLDINEEDLLNYYLISKKHYQPFLAVNTDRKLEVIGRFTNTTVVDKAIAKIKAEFGWVEKEIEKVTSYIDKANGYIEALKNYNTEEAELQWTLGKESAIVKLENDCFTINEEIEKQEERIKEQQAAIDGITLHIENETLRKHLKIQEYELRGKHEETYDTQSKVFIELNKIQQYLAGVITCPNCEHQFSLDKEEAFTDQDFTDCEAYNDELNNQLAMIKLEIDDVMQNLDQIDEEKRENERNTKKINNHKQIITSIDKQIVNLTTSLENKILELDTVTQSTFEDNQESINKQIEEKEQEIAEYNKQLLSCQEQLDKLNIWIDNFNNFKFYLGNVPLALITSLVNQYLKLNGSDLNLQIEGFKKLKSGEIRQALQPVIYRNWMAPHDYNDFSTGEMCRLNLSVDLAFQQLINSSSKSGGLDLYINDEMLSGLDSLGIKNAAESFNNLEKNILLVSHSGQDLNYSNTITIEKKNNISRII